MDELAVIEIRALLRYLPVNSEWSARLALP
jgi:hypothetical protein